MEYKNEEQKKKSEKRVGFEKAVKKPKEIRIMIEERSILFKKLEGCNYGRLDCRFVLIRLKKG